MLLMPFLFGDGADLLALTLGLKIYRCFVAGMWSLPILCFQIISLYNELQPNITPRNDYQISLFLCKNIIFPFRIPVITVILSESIYFIEMEASKSDFGYWVI